MLIELSVTLEPDTTLNDAQRIREELIMVIRQQLALRNQHGAIFGSSLEV